MAKRLISFTLNGKPHDGVATDNTLLLDYLREGLKLTGTKTGCDGGECGACTVLVDGRPQLSCLTLVGQVEGKRVETVEAMAVNGHLSPVQEGFHVKLGSQCGACTPGFIVATEGLLRENDNPTDDDIRAALGSNICRCTGYIKIFEAVHYAAAKMRGETPADYPKVA
jgi:4-hydroxybenzoyl-CoA reductase subunit gamma